ncbi:MULTISPECIES: ABC transporter permease/substrate-binding protein [Staphylococcus]|jgi:osmoprotectant transport system permease protein|uniref:Probable ergothioneine transporter EgtUBC n=1 Tax=Staphylococcus nepalensis TaxID=214473 RepID=A0A291JMM8_9STAP|nr:MULTISPECIES: ABC transporter permease/substrate-binding protein [Staphylococcus]VDG67825.1 glycine betaine/L-proline ABC transporter permease/glycine betaine/L-proline-binding protein [Lacrimispora indolis]ATH60835.1 glycine/betaine ABC transporter permease [Staphylococcus nepalensis]ATH65866.1 glycine/betaine ABC transporter permease [Staphylococcus nepalensis]AWI45255.1 glycine/betaine ABC transporter permease [Staphylococcus nepalensis]MBO1214250.1 ABC transporter permease/substrate-bin
MNELINTLLDRKGQLLTTILEHIQISFIALLIAAVIGVPLGILLTKTDKISEIVMNIAAVLQTIPSLALLGLMIPLFGIGKVPAVIALVVYALLPILRNTYTGISEVDSSLIEAAKGIGMKPGRRLTKVELPLATPVIMAGIRTAMVLIIGTATLAALIGAGGLGDLILLGIDRNDTSLIIIGAIPAALLAILFDLVLRYMQKISYKKLLISLGSMVVILLLVIVGPMLAQKGDKITLAGKLGSEPSVITNMYKILIEDETDNTVEVKDGMGKTTFLFNALKSDDIDGYLEFTGTVLGELTKEDLKSKQEDKVYNQAKSSLEDKYDITMLKPMKYNNTYSLAVKKDFAEKHDLKTIGDLNKVSDQIKPGFTLEFNDRSDGYPAVKKAYDLNVGKAKTMEPKLRYQAVESGDINLIDAYSTDAELKQYDMVILEDDKKVFPPYQGAPMFKTSYLESHPEIKAPLNKLEDKISDEDMQQMNYEVTVKKQDPYQVAKNYLEKHDLVD